MADLSTLVVRFARALRGAGMGVTPAESVAAMRALAVVDLGDRREVYLALRSVLVSRPEDFAAFDELFAPLLERRRRREIADAEARGGETARAPDPRPQPCPPPLRALARAVGEARRWGRGAGRDSADGHGGLALAQKDFSGFGVAELEEITRVARRIARRLANRPSRRWRPARRGARVDLRRTARGSFRTQGEAVRLCFRTRKRRKAKLVVLCDVSGSMDVYGRLLLQFLYAMQNVFARVETFVFSTRLRRITDALRGGTYGAALRQLSTTTREWSGGTQIGESLASFHAEWEHLVDRRTIVVILSDGWDTGPPEQLETEMLRLRREAGKVVWLNPLLGSPGYEPLSRAECRPRCRTWTSSPQHTTSRVCASWRGI